MRARSFWPPAEAAQVDYETLRSSAQGRAQAKAWDEPLAPDMHAATNTPRQFGQLQNLSLSDTFDNPLPDVEVAALVL